MGVLRSIVGLALALAMPAEAAGAWPGQVTPQSTALPANALDATLRAVPKGGCRDHLRAELGEGRRVDGGPDCDPARRALLEGLPTDRAWRARAFGVVERRHFDLGGGKMVLSVASRCPVWPLMGSDDAVLEPDVAEAAGCRLQRYEGPVDVWVERGDGAWSRIEVAKTDPNGAIRIDFLRLDRILRARGEPGLADANRLAFGAEGWAGSVNLPRLREVKALWHFTWVQRGRGSAGLFAQLHPDHVRTGDARALAVEATLARQEQDYRAVAAGALRPETFLARHAWSPYRASVLAMLARSGAPTPDAAAVRRPDSGQDSGQDSGVDPRQDVLRDPRGGPLPTSVGTARPLGPGPAGQSAPGVPASGASSPPADESAGRRGESRPSAGASSASKAAGRTAPRR